MLDLQPSTIVFQIINFLILLVILARFLYQPLQRTMQQRQAAITARLNDAAAREAEAIAERRQLAEQAEAARVESERALAQARAEVATERAQLLEDAGRQASRVQAAAERDIRERERLALDSTAAQVRATAISLAASLIRQAAGPTVHQALLDRFIATGLPASAATDTELVVELAYPPDAQLQQRLTDLTQARLTYQVNPELCAGLRIFTSQQVLIELSLRQTLQELQSRTNGVAR